MFLIFCLLIFGVNGESMHGVTRERIIQEENILHDMPELSEWNYENPECKLTPPYKKFITKTRHFYMYIVKLGFTGVYIIFLISAQNIDCGYSLEPPRRGGSNEYPQSMF